MSLENLTEKETEIKEKIKEEWFKIETSTTPCNREVVEEAIDNLYRLSGMNNPAFVYCQSPKEAQRKIQFLKYMDKDGRLPEGLKRVDTEKLKEEISSPDSYCFGGQFDSHWIAYYIFARKCGESYDEKSNVSLDLFTQLAKEISWWWSFEKVAVYCDKPLKINYITDESRNKLLHGIYPNPAFEYRNGDVSYAYKGMILPHKYGSVCEEEWDPKWIMNENNAELRHILIDVITYDRMIRELNTKVVDKWREYELLEIPYQLDELNYPRFLSMIDLHTKKLYINRVPPDLSIKEAVNWMNHGIEEFTKEV